MKAKRTIRWLALFTLIVFPLLGYGIHLLFGEGGFPLGLPAWPESFYVLLIGTAFGVLAGEGAWELIRSEFMRPVRARYGSLIASLRLTRADMWYISVCAGVGEELLFRAAIQPLLGLVWTSLLFVALHGYLNPFDRRLFVYGLFMTAFILVVGVFFLQLGIWSCIAAHIAIDYVLLRRLSAL